MRRNKHAQLDLFFKDILPHWREDIPELSSLLEAEKFVKGEHLVNDWGDLYLITEGIFGKYEKTCPVRYALAGESLMIPNQKHNYRFVALSDCQTFRTSFRQLEAINAYNPKVFYLYAHLKDKQLGYLDYRHKLLSLHNQDKYDFVFDHYPELLAYITQKELAQFMGISMELLRRMMRDRAY